MRRLFPRVAAPFLIACLAAVISGDHSAQARWYNPRIGIGYGVGYGLGYGGYGMGWGYPGYYGGGTAAGNYMQGAADIIRARGQYNEQTSRAMINYEDARSKYIDNRKKWTETYFAMKEQNQAKAAEKLERSRHSPEVLTAAAHSAAPKPLSNEALDPVTGKILWPEALLAPEYEKPRQEIEQLLELSASSGAANSIRLQGATQQMIATLKNNIENLPVHDYIAARKFLDSLAYSVRV